MAMSKHRRSNAGNRLQALLEDQEPLDAADAEFFAEKDDDEDFDIEAEEERIRRERSEAANTKEYSGDEGEGEEDNDGKDTQNIDEEGDNDDESSVSAADSNFSDSSDDSDIENDAEPADAGERQLQQEQRQRERAKKSAERAKIFTIKRRPAPVSEGAQPPKPKKKRLFTSADLIMEKGRKSERRSALRNKEHLIEQMKAAEERRAQYVHPAKPRAPKLTQEQRLEEAKKTEIRNLSTLNKFVELEEERKLQQRLAMISRRPKLTHFVRFHSSSLMEPPKLIEVMSEIFPGNSSEPTPEPFIKSECVPPMMTQNNSPHLSHPQITSTNQIAPDTLSRESQGLKDGNLPQNFDGTTHKNRPDTPSKPDDISKPEITSNSADPRTMTDVNKSEEVRSCDSTKNLDCIDKGETGPSPLASQVKTELNQENDPPKSSEIITETTNEAGETKIEAQGELEETQAVQGPNYLRSYNFLTLHEFPGVSLNRFSIRNIVLGSSANSSQPPLKRMCPFDGKPAKYRDPNTNVAYTSLETCRLIQMVRENKLGWSKELGGVFTVAASPQRPAKGVPEWF